MLSKEMNEQPLFGLSRAIMNSRLGHGWVKAATEEERIAGAAEERSAHGPKRPRREVGDFERKPL
jgi:hypothetical protein